MDGSGLGLVRVDWVVEMGLVGYCDGLGLMGLCNKNSLADFWFSNFNKDQ